MVHDGGATLTTFTLSLTVTVNVYCCAGPPTVPDSTPAVDSVKPGGKLPVAVYVYPGVPPVAEKVYVYADPMLATSLDPVGHVVDGGGATVNVHDFRLVPPAESTT